MFNQRNPQLLLECFQERDFPIGVELVSARGSMAQDSGRKVRAFGEELKDHPSIDWVSITDNAGGHPQMAPVALGMPILYGGKEVVIHLTGKDLNRHSLESQLWMLASHGFHNVLALSGDYPNRGKHGRAKPVFDLDSVGILNMIREMNEGLEAPSRRSPDRRLAQTRFTAGATVNPFKSRLESQHPQWLKLALKVQCGANFIIPQIGFDVLRMEECRHRVDRLCNPKVPLIANVFVLSKPVLELFHRGVIPGVHLDDDVHQQFSNRGEDRDQGRAFFEDFVARQVAVYRHFGYDGCTLAGVHNCRDLDRILERAESYAKDAPQIAESMASTAKAPESGEVPLKEKLNFRLSQKVHEHCFSKDSKTSHRIGSTLGHWEEEGWRARSLHLIEKKAKGLLFRCQDCGDCALPRTSFICPESQCPKNMRNGPCGGAQGVRCEVRDTTCIWARAYQRISLEGREEELLKLGPMVQDHGKRGCSSWLQHWRDLNPSPT